MKRAAIALRKAQGAFLILHMHEMEVLRSLPSWMVSLFTALLQHADHATGHGQVSYAVLASMLAPIQPRSGPRLFAPDIQAIKKAVRQLEARLIVARDKRASMNAALLFFAVVPRYESVRPNPKLEPLTRTPVDSRKPSVDAGSEGVGSGTRTPNSNPSSIIEILIHSDAELSTAELAKPTIEQRRMLERVKRTSKLN